MPDVPSAISPGSETATQAALRERGRRAAVRISLVYLAVGLLWIAVSDRLLTYLTTGVGDTGNLLTYLQTMKGWIFIVVTSALLFFAVRSYMRSIQETERQLHLDLRRTTSAYEMLFTSSPLALWIYDLATRDLLAANDAALAAFGYARVEFLKMKLQDLHPPESHPRLQETLRLIVGAPGQKRASGLWRLWRKDKTFFDAEIVSHEFVFEGRSARLVLAIDVTARLQAQRAAEEHRAELEGRVAARTSELSKANEQLKAEAAERAKVEEQLRAASIQAQAASEAKSAFLANTSHEIRTPLTSILGYAELLLEGDLPAEERQRHVGVVQQNAAHLLRLIDDLLDLSRAEMGKMTITMGEISAEETARQTMDLLEPKAMAKGLPLTLKVEPGVPEVLTTDGVRLRQVLTNLLSNAIKFTARGEVILRVRVAGETVCFDVVDTGIGIATEQLPRIFEPFYQGEQGGDRRYPGNGLGLSISQQLVEQMGGRIEIQSEVGRGSTFSVCIPVTPKPEVVEVATPVEGSGESRISGHVLLAEDNANVRWLVEEYLRRAGATVTSVSNGAEAVERVQAMLKDPGEAAIDLILMDIHMPEMDGPEAMRRMRAAGYKGAIVALTAHSMTEEHRQWLAAGCDAVAAKPINRHSFIPLIARLMETRGEERKTVGANTK
jgi:PAS domain S-box-containing protein